MTSPLNTRICTPLAAYVAQQPCRVKSKNKVKAPMPEALLPQDAPVEYTKQWLDSGGTKLCLHRWAPPDGKIAAHVLVLHGYMDHGMRYAELARHLCLAGFAVTAMDFRGHGLSEGQRGYVDRFDQYVEDAQAALAVLDPNAPHFVLGHSNGGLTTLKLMHDRNPKVAGVIVTNPFLAQTVPARGPKLWVGKLAGRYFPHLSLPSGLQSKQLTHDQLLVQARERDTLVFSTANAGWFREVSEAQEQVRSYTNIASPLLYVYSDADPIASPQANNALSGQLQSPDKTVLMRNNELHEVLNEVDRASLHHNIAAWLRAHLPNKRN